MAENAAESVIPFTGMNPRLTSPIFLGRRGAGLSVGICLLLGTLRLSAQSAWSVQDSPTAQDLWGVCPGFYGSFVAVGGGGTILTGYLGGPFTQQTSGTTNWLLAVTYAEQLYVAVGDNGTILYSDDGAKWTLVTAGSARLNGIAYAGPNHDGLWLAVGEGGAIARSPNGVVWTAGNAGVSGWLRGVVYRSDLGEFVITGQGGIVLTTSDGINFKHVVSGTDSDIECAATVGNPTETVAAGTLGYVGGSLDDSTWSAIAPVSQTHFRGAASIGSTAIFVGSGGAVLNVVPGPPVAQSAPAVTTSDLTAVAVGTDQEGAPAAAAVGLGGVIIGTPLAVPVAGTLTSSVWAPPLGGTVTLSSNAAGQPPLSYQWALNGTAIPGATGPTLVLPDIQATQNGDYSLSVTNALGASTSHFTVAAVYQPSIPGLVDEGYSPAMKLPFMKSIANGYVESMPAAAALQADGKVVINGSIVEAQTAATVVSSIMRFNADGTPDSAFNAAVGQSEAFVVVTRIYIQPDAKILVSTFVPGGLIGRSDAVSSFRLNPDGTTDSSYAPEIVAAGVVPTQDAIPQIMLSDGRYLAARNGLTVRLTPNGSIDPTFAATSPAGTSYVLDPAARVIVGGGSSIFRLNPDGTPDPTFSTANTGATVGPLFLQPSGKIVYGTTSSPSATGAASETFSRLNGDGTPDSTYAGFTTDILATVAASAMTPDGSLWLDLIANSPAQSPTQPLVNIGGHDHNGFVRIDPNGDFDPTYALDVEAVNVQPESASLGAFAEPAAIGGILPAPNGQWYVWGSFASFNGEPRAGLVRINPQVGAQFSKLGNVSTRSAAGTRSQTLIVGFVTQGPADMKMLLRGVGPGLASFGVSGFLPDPEIALYDSSDALQLSDNNWGDAGNAPAIAAAEQEVGAFALSNGSLDAAALATLGPGGYTFDVYGNAGGTGIALAEAYDTNTAPPSFSGPRAVNFSCRSTTSPGAGVLTAGFVVEGGNAKRVLIRAVGPSLASFGVSGVLADPTLTLYSGGTAIATSGPGWSQDAVLGSVFADVGAFGLAAGSGDSAMSLLLAPGAYTAQVASQSGASGVVLVEVYEVP
jgi:uncharacterized delta-60 repeat protein